MWGAKAVASGTKTTPNQNTNTLATESVNMKVTQLTTSNTKTVQNGSTRDTAVPGREWKTRISHHRSLQDCRNTVTDRNVTVIRSCDSAPEHRLSTALETQPNITEHFLVSELKDCCHPMYV
jgi:hypothetical protein